MGTKRENKASEEAENGTGSDGVMLMGQEDTGEKTGGMMGR